MQGDVSSPRVSRREFVVFELGGRMVRSICIVLLSLLLQGCARPSVHEPVTLTLLGQEWRTTEFNQGWQQELQQFTNETGIQVRLLPSPEAVREQLTFWRESLARGASGPDVYGLDVIWPGMLAEYFIDLKPYFNNEISTHFPAIVEIWLEIYEIFGQHSRPHHIQRSEEHTSELQSH